MKKWAMLLGIAALFAGLSIVVHTEDSALWGWVCGWVGGVIGGVIISKC